jgi:hypothetical protein
VVVLASLTNTPLESIAAMYIGAISDCIAIETDWHRPERTEGQHLTRRLSGTKQKTPTGLLGLSGSILFRIFVR